MVYRCVSITKNYMLILLSKMNVSFVKLGRSTNFERCSTLTNLEISIGSSTLNFTPILIKFYRNVFNGPKLQISESELNPLWKGAFDAP